NEFASPQSQPAIATEGFDNLDGFGTDIYAKETFGRSSACGSCMVGARW
ncbi:MAG: hypothetical protein RLY20_721, partial [Verrucomicrobiota bacterium]